MLLSGQAHLSSKSRADGRRRSQRTQRIAIRRTLQVNSCNRISEATVTSCLTNDLCASASDSASRVVQTNTEGVRTGRRQLILSVLLGALAVRSDPATADDAKLPKEYRQLVKRLSEGLSESIEAEASGASEAEVRRKADPAKDTVREFVRKWRDNPRVSADITHAEVKEALAELGEFYLAYGQRTKLTPPVRDSVLRHLAAARDALPLEPSPAGKDKDTGVLGLF